MLMDAIAIKPCPFCDFANCKVTCKRRGNYKREGDNYQVLCGRCKARGPLVQDDEARAIALWNKQNNSTVQAAMDTAIKVAFGTVCAEHTHNPPPMAFWVEAAKHCHACAIRSFKLQEWVRSLCWCETCRPQTIADMRFIVCPDCGNKRCPRATNHENACTNSNEPGQPGSSYA